MSDIFKNVSKRDLDIAFRNTGRKVKRKTCKSNGTRYTMNRVRHTDVNAIGKTIDHRFKDKTIKPKTVNVMENGEWKTVHLSKNAKRKLERYKKEVKQVSKVEKQALYAHEIKD